MGGVEGGMYLPYPESPLGEGHEPGSNRPQHTAAPAIAAAKAISTPSTFRFHVTCLWDLVPMRDPHRGRSQDGNRKTAHTDRQRGVVHRDTNE
jgi:hypothetical protein